jgi:hypothetical protein
LGSKHKAQRAAEYAAENDTPATDSTKAIAEGEDKTTSDMTDAELFIEQDRLQKELDEQSAKALHPSPDDQQFFPKAAIPTFPQPGVDPMGRPFSFNLNAPDQLTWKFGWAETTRRTCKEDIQSGVYPMYDRAPFADQIRAWSSLQDCDFPEYYYIDRLNDGKSFLYQKVPFSDIAAIWSVPVVPPAIPQASPELIDQTQSRPHDQMVLMVRAQNTVTGLFPKFFKHDVAINQFIFGANINSRNECKDKFEGVRGRLKM